MRRLNKKADLKWDYVGIILLGILVFIIILYFIFSEFFQDGAIDNEVCRESVLLRANLGEVNSGSFTWKSFKDEYPLKCKTQVLTIDYEDIDKAERLVAESIAGCWYLYGEGALNPFPSGVGFKSYCVPCARIKISEKYKDYYRENKIDILRGLNQKFRKETFLDFLNDDYNSFPAFSIAGARPFKFDSDYFHVDVGDLEDATFRDTLHHSPSEDARATQIHLPRFFDADKGELVVALDFVVSTDKVTDFYFVPFTFFYQTDSKTDIYDESEKMIVDGPFWSNAELCNQWDGIPA